MKKKIFISLIFIIIVATAITVFLLTRHSKSTEKERDYYVVRSSDTLYKEPITVEYGTTFYEAIYKLNLGEPWEMLKDDYELEEIITRDMTIQIK